MTFPEIAFLAIVLLVGLPSGWRLDGHIRNLTAVALSLAWFAGWGIYMLTGEGMPIRAMFLADLTVMALIYCKPEYTECDYAGFTRHLCAFWKERSPWDRAVLSIFPVAWIFYVLPISDHARYWTLYSLAAAQFMLAGWEAFNPLLGRMANTLHADPPDIPTGLAWSYGGDG